MNYKKNRVWKKREAAIHKNGKGYGRTTNIIKTIKNIFWLKGHVSKEKLGTQDVNANISTALLWVTLVVQVSRVEPVLCNYTIRKIKCVEFTHPPREKYHTCNVLWVFGENKHHKFVISSLSSCIFYINHFHLFQNFLLEIIVLIWHVRVPRSNFQI